MSTENDTRFWSTLAPKYAKSKIGDEAGYENTLRRTREFLKTGDHVLELGCGTGSTALRLATAVNSYLATDIAPGMIAIAGDKLAAGPVSGLTFEVATAESLALPETGFDVVLGFNYLHLVADPQATLRRVHGLLRPGGLAITKTVCLKEMNRLIPLAIRLMRLVGKAPDTVARLDEADVINAHEAAGFEILHAERHGTKGSDIRPYIVARRAS